MKANREAKFASNEKRSPSGYYMSKEELRAMTDEVIANAEKRTAKAVLKSIRRSRRHENIQTFVELKISASEDESSGDE